MQSKACTVLYLYLGRSTRQVHHLIRCRLAMYVLFPLSKPKQNSHDCHDFPNHGCIPSQSIPYFPPLPPTHQCKILHVSFHVHATISRAARASFLLVVVFGFGPPCPCPCLGPFLYIPERERERERGPDDDPSFPSMYKNGFPCKCNLVKETPVRYARPVCKMR
jgi:hypothetical protein